MNLYNNKLTQVGPTAGLGRNKLPERKSSVKKQLACGEFILQLCCGICGFNGRLKNTLSAEM